MSTTSAAPAAALGKNQIRGVLGRGAMGTNRSGGTRSSATAWHQDGAPAR